MLENKLKMESERTMNNRIKSFLSSIIMGIIVGVSITGINRMVFLDGGNVIILIFLNSVFPFLLGMIVNTRNECVVGWNDG